MKRIVSAFFVLMVHCAAGQHGNEWIRFGQEYFKIPVAKEGLYRLSYQDLRQAGVDVSVDPRNFQLFHRGIEQAILVEGGNDGVFHSTDHIEFIGRGNDGVLDSTLYAAPGLQPHRLYNLYSDTTSYFLTYGASPGKRMASYAASAEGLMSESHHLAEKLLILKEQYAAGKDYGNIWLTAFDEGEGWTGVQILQNQVATYSLEGISHIYPVAGKPVIEVLLTGRGPMNHHVDLYAGSRLLASLSFAGYQSYRHTQAIEWSDIDSNGKFALTIKVTGVAGADRVSAGYIRLTYPQQITMGGEPERRFLVGGSTSSPSYVNIQNAPAGTRLFDITNPAAPLSIGSTAGATLDAVVPAGARRIWATAASNVPATVKKVTFRRFTPQAFNYIIITHPSLRRAAAGYTDPVKAYAEYRSFPEGGGFDTVVVNIDQLYNQFNYGEQSPRAIFQFLRYCIAANRPDHVFFIGKGLNVNYGYYRKPGAYPLYKDLVPTAGFPASDMAFTAAAGTHGVAPAVSTGRLTAISPEEVAAYLNKVKERDATPFDNLNRKKILHLSGGIETYEPVMFRNILSEFAHVAEGKYLGAGVRAIAKQSTADKLINIADEVNDGLGLITFFGHSAPNTTDFDIGHVTDPVLGYHNKGKYPLLLMNGCDAGSFFLNTTIFGENWIKASDRGAVGFIAHSSYGLLSGLHRYSSTFYDVAFADSLFISRGIGHVQQEIAKRYIEKFGATPNAISQVQQMVLLGDPAVKLFGAEKPDYAVNTEEISASSFDGEPVTALTDSFSIHIPVKNFGITGSKKIRIAVDRQSPDQPSITYDTIVSSVLHTDTISVTVRNRDAKGSGINVFSITVDADDLIAELDESNNSATFELFIPLNSTKNLFPYNFSIVRSREVDLSFQFTDLQAASRDFVLEIDTTHTFDSPFRKQFAISATVLGRQRVQLLPEDSVAYYWRTRIADPLATESSAWASSSFTFIEDGPEGWAQIRFPQFSSNAVDGLVGDPVLRRLHYEETISDIAVRTFSSAAGYPLDSVSFRINGAEFNLLNQGAACRNNTINFVAFDRKSTQPYAGLYFTWYELLYNYGGRMLLCGREPYVINSFRAAELITGNGDDLTRYVDNIAAGDSVVIFSIGDAGYLQWPQQAKFKLAELGITEAQLTDLQNGDAVVIFGRKGAAAGSAQVFKTSSGTSRLQVERTIAGRYSSGTMTSAVVGPAQRWQSLVVDHDEEEAADDVWFSVVGIGPDGVQDTLRTDIHADCDLSFIDAAIYPKLKVVLHTVDDIDLTSVQLDRWLVLYEPVAEGIVFFRGAAERQVLAEGQEFTGAFGFVNVSDKQFNDSLLVRYELSPTLRHTTGASTLKIGPPAPGDTTLFTIRFDTREKEGLNDVEVFVNPRVMRESSYDNNLVLLNDHVEVLPDDRAPVIDVTFDGRHIENNEYVSASPSIIITLRDENPFMLKQDTAGVNVFLAHPCANEDCEFKRISFTRDDITWQPASSTSDFVIHFTPVQLEEGAYTLRVEGRDANGNAAGQEPYEINFQVDYEPALLASAPYPNPFSVETTFEMTLSGAGDASASFVLEIMTLNGGLVERLTAGGLHVGINRVRWNGTGRDGRNLPDGIYLYRLVITAAGREHVYRGKIVRVQ